MKLIRYNLFKTGKCRPDNLMFNTRVWAEMLIKFHKTISSWTGKSLKISWRQPPVFPFPDRNCSVTHHAHNPHDLVEDFFLPNYRHFKCAFLRREKVVNDKNANGILQMEGGTGWSGVSFDYKRLKPRRHLHLVFIRPWECLISCNHQTLLLPFFTCLCFLVFDFLSLILVRRTVTNSYA